MDAVTIGVIVFGIIFIVGGTIVSLLTTKANLKAIDKAKELQKK